MRTKLFVLLLVVSLGAVPLLLAQEAEHVWTVSELFTRNIGTQQEQRTQFPPHRIIGNLYYVGTQSLSSFVVDTPAGDILIDSTYEVNVPVIQDSMSKLGLKFSNIKIILGSHAHGDHQEADAMVAEMTGAKVMALAEDIPDLQRMRTPSGKPRPMYQVLHDGDEVKLGGMTLVAHLTPGHTHGCTTWTMKVQEAGDTHNVVIIGSMGVNTGTRLWANGALTPVGEEYARGFKAMHTLAGDVPLGSHPAMHGLAEKYKKLSGSGLGIWSGALFVPNPYIDPTGYLKELKIEETAFNMELENQKKAPPAAAPAPGGRRGQ
ncbi:MAG TPA: MBL fold metallo-hydrolase [Terriglobia bacterium]|nr:MBL fold metallo-hydrolase [Terriglobia bacterium]